MVDLPAGTVTFVFTDIERSTLTIASLGDKRYAALQAVHRSLLRKAFNERGGQEVGTEGDAIFVVFTRAADAAIAALDAQRLIEAHDWEAPGTRLRVRIGLHTGEAQVNEQNYVGHDVHKAKRIADAGHGGQILLSRTTRDLVASHLPSDAQITHLGAHRLKDIAQPEDLYQLTGVGLETSFPALRSLGPSNALPVELTSFVGRERELALVQDLLGTHRLVTLTGVGGSGKTRLALRAAASEFDRSPDGVYFCDLSQVAEEESVAPHLLRSLGVDVTQTRNRHDRDVLLGYLAERSVLVVVDNCEHVINEVADVLGAILLSCPKVRILATSREALDAEGEQAWPVPSLAATSDAVALFVERAAAARTGFELSDQNAAEIEAICSRLDGMPLAIELAAAQVSHLAPKQIADRLDDRFTLLTGGRRRVQRQQTLQATMDWSWDLLASHDQTLLQRLAVFQGGWTLDAAERVCGESLDVLRGMRSLVSKSLVIASEHGESLRYRFLETVRIYAEARLAATEEASELRTRHRDWYLEFAESTFDRKGFIYLISSPLLPETENIRAAIRWSEALGQDDMVARLLTASNAVWVYASQEGMSRLRAALETDLEPTLRGRVLASFSNFGASTGTDTSLDMRDEAIRLLETEPTPWLVLALTARSIVGAISAVSARDADEVRRTLAFADRAINVAEGCAPAWSSWAYGSKGLALMTMLRTDEAREPLLKAVAALSAAPAAFNVAPLPESTTSPAVIEALAATRLLHPEKWTETDERTFTAARDNYMRTATHPPSSMAFDAANRGDFDAALVIVRTGVETIRGIAPDLALRSYLVYAGIVWAMFGEAERAARLFGAGFKEGILLSPSAFALYRHWLPLIRAEIDGGRARDLRAAGAAMSLGQALDYAFAV